MSCLWRTARLTLNRRDMQRKLRILVWKMKSLSAMDWWMCFCTTVMRWKPLRTATPLFKSTGRWL